MKDVERQALDIDSSVQVHTAPRDRQRRERCEMIAELAEIMFLIRYFGERRQPIHSRDFVQVLSTIVVLLGIQHSLQTQVYAANADKPSNRPNIIYIMADDLGYGDLGCYGQRTIKTPNLDRMAAEGMRFTNHYAGHTVCRPSRLVLWTGQHVGHTRLIGNRARRLTSKEPTVAKLLQQAGYATGGVGKWALGNVSDPTEIDNTGHPLRNGFDYWYGYLNQGRAHNYYPPYLWENEQQVVLPGNVLRSDGAGNGRVSSQRVSYSHDFMTSAAMNFIRENQGRPFLLHVHWTIPHANNEAGRVLKDGMEVPNYGQYTDRSWPNPEKGFAAMVSHMDRDVGRIFALLKELKIDNRTLVFFTSDNGPHQEGGHQHEFFNSNGPLKGYKRSMHEGGIRVPMLARWPGSIAPGSTTDLPSAFWDFLPTACEAAGIRPAQTIDGISYLPTLLGNHDRQARHKYLYWASSEGKTSVGIRSGEWKLVRYRSAEWRLYNLRHDLGEQHNVAEDHPEVVAELLEMLKNDGLL